MKITILTLFPQMFQGPFNLSILKKAQEKGLLEIMIQDIRDFGIGKHKLVDDTPYGGGIGMVMRVDVLHQAIEAVKESLPASSQRVILMSAGGKQFRQTTAKQYATLKHLIIVCGHYEGVDARIAAFVDEEISVGDFITTGGEIPAMLITDAVARLVPGVLKEGVTEHESFSLLEESGAPLLEYPQYTNPQEYLGRKVPEILLSGNHKKIAEWRKEQAKKKTKQTRPDLLLQEEKH